jgi:hypothetical protein
VATEPLTLQKEELWNLLVDSVHTLPMYKNHKRFVENVMLKERPEISQKELAIQLNLTVGEATVILYELRGSPKREQAPTSPASPSQKTTDHSLLDFAK